MKQILKLLIAVCCLVCLIAAPMPAYAQGQATLTTPTPGDGHLSVSVNPYGKFSGATYDPIGSIGPATTTYDSEVALRIGATGARTYFSGNAEFTKTESNRAQSNFSQSGLDFQLTQSVDELFDGSTRSGSLLIQSYTITNPGTTSISFELVRYMDGDLNFDGSRDDGGGGNSKLLFETDKAGESSGATTFVAITGEGGTIPQTNRYEVNACCGTLQTEISSGKVLQDIIVGDNNGDGFVDSGYDVALGLRNTFELAAGKTVTYVTRTRFGAGSVALEPSALPDRGITEVNKAVSIDVLANDFSPKDGPFIVAFDANSANGGQVAKADNLLRYTPANNFVGADQFNYTISAGGDEKTTSIVKVTVLPALEAQSTVTNTAFSYTVPSAVTQTGTLTASLADGSALPSWLSFDASTGKFSGTTPSTAVGKISLQVTVNDGNGETVNIPWQVTVLSPNRPPVVANAMTKQIAIAGQNFTFTVPTNTFSDPDGDALTLSVASLPSWLSYNSSTKTLSGTPDLGDKNLTLKVTATDPHGAKVSTPLVVDVYISSADCEVHDGEISGVKWNDLNGDGKRQGDIVQGDVPDVFMVIDVSDSTTKDKFVGSTNVGDVNADSRSDTILDSEIKAFVELNEQLIAQGLGETAKVSITVFGSRSADVDLDPQTPGQQVTLAPSTDSNGDGKSDLEAILLGLKDRAYGVGGYTNYEAALQTVQSLVEKLGTKSGQGTVVFLSDGKPTKGGDYTDEVESLKKAGVKLVAFGVGKEASLPALQKIDPQAEIFSTTDTILDVFSGLKARQGVVRTPTTPEVGLSKVTIYLDLNKNGKLDSDEPARITGDNGRYQFRSLALGTYIVREVSDNYKQTAPKDGFAQVNLTAEKPTVTVNFGNQVKAKSDDSDTTTLININGKTNNKDNPISQTFPAGSYRVSSIGIADGGMYDTWNASGTVQGCDANGENCSLGWEARYYFRPPYNKVSDTTCTKQKYGSCRYDSATKALEKAPAPVLFSLDKETEMLFYIEDTEPSNNAGGISLKVEQLASKS